MKLSSPMRIVDRLLNGLLVVVAFLNLALAGEKISNGRPPVDWGTDLAYGLGLLVMVALFVRSHEMNRRRDERGSVGWIKRYSWLLFLDFAAVVLGVLNIWAGIEASIVNDWADALLCMLLGVVLICVEVTGWTQAVKAARE